MRNVVGEVRFGLLNDGAVSRYNTTCSEISKPLKLCDVLGHIPIRMLDENRSNRRHHISGDQRAQLAAGKLGLVQFDGQYHLRPVSIARQLHEKIPQRTWVPQADADQAADADDPYADFQVPDDLMW